MAANGVLRVSVQGRALRLSTTYRNSLFGLVLIASQLTSCMGQPNDVVLVTRDAVSVFTTRQESLAPSVGNRLAILEPDARVAVLDCLDEGGYSIYKIRLSDGRTGFVKDGDYTLSNSKYSDSVWCGAKPRNPQWRQGWITDCSGPDFSKSTVSGVTDPDSERPVFRINHQLVVAVPKSFSPYAGSLGHEPRTCTKLSDLPSAPFLYFVIRGNWSAGYKPEDIPTSNGEKEFRPDVVTVRIEREPPNNLSNEEQEKVQKLLLTNREQDFAGAQNIGDLTCDVRNGYGHYCFGHRIRGEPDVTRFRYLQYTRIPSFVRIDADYESTHYGKVHVYWWVWTSNVSHALEIDAAIWKTMEEWNILNPT